MNTAKDTLKQFHRVLLKLVIPLGKVQKSIHNFSRYKVDVCLAHFLNGLTGIFGQRNPIVFQKSN